MPPAFSISDEYSPLRHVIAGRGAGFHRDPGRVAVVNTLQAASGHPAPAWIAEEMDGLHAALRAHGVCVHIPELGLETVQDQTCPRDIGMVLGDAFVAAAMSVESRQDELAGIETILSGFTGPRHAAPAQARLEGGDVIIDGDTVFVGHGQRSGPEGAIHLARLCPDRRIVPVPCRHGPGTPDILHLDCTFNPLGLGHALIFPEGMAHIPPAMRAYRWIEVTASEARALATNVLSLAPDHILARDHPDCARVNDSLRAAGYRVSTLRFDAVPSIGGSFRCATLPLIRAAQI